MVKLSVLYGRPDDRWIESLSLDAAAIETMPGGIRALMVTDPEGNTIQLGG
jgi:hypothetical protein